jgi:heat-inducible transcriptional repressor
MTLTDRRKALLRFIVDDYVTTAQPVGSSALVERYKLKVSSATIRNEMAALEDAGLVTHPHTSAGRVPTDAGYRFYIEELMMEEDLADEVRQTIRHQFHQAARELEEWARLAAAILASRLHNAAVVTTPHSAEPRVRLVELVSVHDYLALLVVVLQEARVLQQTLSLDQPFSQEELNSVGKRLNELMGGKSAVELRETITRLTGLEQTTTTAAAGLLEATDELSLEPSYTEGMRDLLRQPEFAGGSSVLGLLEAMEDRNLPRSIAAPMTVGEMNIVIGGEHPVDEMQGCTVITTRYRGPSGLRGVLSVVGPTRMEYPRNVATVRYMAALMEELLGVYFA